jgi:hemoglobin
MSSAESADTPSSPPFDLLGGEPAVRQLVDRFYDLMDLEPAFSGIRALHPDTLDGSRDKLHWFLCGWLGGPQLYVEKFGHPRLRARHMPYSIGIAERDQWMACMTQAMRESHIDESMAERLVESFFGTADWMRNRGA